MSTLFLALALQLQIPPPVGYVNDLAGIIDPATQREMQAVIDEVRQKSGGEIVVVTLPDLGGRESIDVARDIGRQWRVGGMGGPGDPARNTGVVLLLKPGARPGDGQADMAIATGTGAEGFLTDATTGQIRREAGEVSTAAGEYDAGLLRGVQRLGQVYAREFQFELTGAPTLPPPPRRGTGSSIAGLLPLLLLLFFFFALFSSRRGRRRPGGLLSSLLWGAFWGNVGRRGSWGAGGHRSGGGGWGGGGGFGGFGGGGGFSGGGSSGRF